MNLVDLPLGMGLEKLDFLAEYKGYWIRNGTQLREGIAGTFQQITTSIKQGLGGLVYLFQSCLDFSGILGSGFLEPTGLVVKLAQPLVEMLVLAPSINLGKGRISLAAVA